MAAALGKRRIVKRSPVRRIVQRRGRVRVVSDRAVVIAKRAIVAVPPVLAGRIDYHPAMPAARDALTQRLAQGALTKVAASYPNAVLARAGAERLDALDRTASSTRPSTTAPRTAGPASSSASSAATARAASPTSARRPAAARCWPSSPSCSAPRRCTRPSSSTPSGREQRWSRGGPVGIYPPGLMTTYGHAIREPVGRIHWAGTETSTYWNGYMDGAIRSGERAAAEVLEEL